MGGLVSKRKDEIKEGKGKQTRDKDGKYVTVESATQTNEEDIQMLKNDDNMKHISEEMSKSSILVKEDSIAPTPSTVLDKKSDDAKVAPVMHMEVYDNFSDIFKEIFLTQHNHPHYTYNPVNATVIDVDFQKPINAYFMRWLEPFVGPLQNHDPPYKYINVRQKGLKSLEVLMHLISAVSVITRKYPANRRIFSIESLYIGSRNQ